MHFLGGRPILVIYIGFKSGLLIVEALKITHLLIKPFNIAGTEVQFFCGKKNQNRLFLPIKVLQE